MINTIDKQIIAGFVSEAKSYIPQIQVLIETLRGETENVEKIEEIHRYISDIKNASSMIGVTGLSEISNYMEKILEDLASKNIEFSSEVVLFLTNIIDHISRFLDSLLTEASIIRERLKKYKHYMVELAVLKKI